MEQKYQIVIEEIPKNKNSVLKTIRLLGALELKQSKAIFEYLEKNFPCPIATGLDKEPAEEIVKQLQEIGITAKLNKTDIVVPMILFPPVNSIFEWNWLLGFRQK